MTSKHQMRTGVVGHMVLIVRTLVLPLVLWCLLIVSAHEAGLKPPHPRASSAQYSPDWNSLNSRPLPKWFSDAKFGIFIHWGVYSVPAWAIHGRYAEWYWMSSVNPHDNFVESRAYHQRNYDGTDYMDMVDGFKAELFNASYWADLFYRSGAKYVVPTSKHHDGFALWPSAHASSAYGRPWNAADAGPRRDLIGEIAQAVRARGLKFGLYYSLYEWFHPLWRPGQEETTADYVNSHMLPQLKDVVQRYAPSLIFSDGEWDLYSDAWRSAEFLAWLYNESPCADDVIVNDRWGKECRHTCAGYYTTEYAAGLSDGRHPWEESRGMAHSYGYNRAERLADYKTGQEFVFMLVDIVSRGGNLLLNVGPSGDGSIPVIMEQRLVEIGDWLRVNGEAIFDSTPSARSCQYTQGAVRSRDMGLAHSFQVAYSVMDLIGREPRNGIASIEMFFTAKKIEDVAFLYVISVGFPLGRLTVRDVEAGPSTQVHMLGVDDELMFQYDGSDIQIHAPLMHPASLPCSHAFTFRISHALLKHRQPHSDL